jgi:hypothetical protein
MSVLVAAFGAFGAAGWTDAWPLLCPNRTADKPNANTWDRIIAGSRFRISKPLLRNILNAIFSD